MQCDSCHHKKATVFLTQIIKGEMQKVNLCEACSKEKGVTDPTGFALADMLLGLGSQSSEGASKERTCPSCGMPQSVFRKTGRLGCSKCYETFADNLEHLLKAMHKGTQQTGRIQHTGKVPSSAAQNVAVSSRLAELQAALNSAVAGEQYEEAARLRDELKRLADKAARAKT